MATAINVNGRKRPLPSTLVDDTSAPPNKKIELPMEKEMREKQKREKELLHQRVAEASKSPFFLQPRIMPATMPMQRTSLVHTPGLSNLGMSTMYPLLQSPVSTGRLSSSSGSRTPIPATPSPGASAGIGVTRPLSAPFYPPLMGYSPQPFKQSPGFSCFPAWSPLHNGIASPAGAGKSAQKPAEGAGSSRCEMTATRNGCGDVMPVASSTCSTTTVTTTVSSSSSTPCTSTTHSIGMTQPLTGILPYVISPHSSLPSIQSPFSFYHHQPSPISPMMFLNSPYANSCPSVSSSSGCSSMSDGSSIVQNFTNGKHVGGIRIAPSEYHVGIRPPISVGHGEAESDDGCGSDRAPSPDEEDPDQIPTTADSSISTCTIVKSSTIKEPSTQQHQPRPSNQAANEVDYPLSVQSLTSSDKSSQSYLSGCQLPCSVERPSSGVSSMSSCASSRESSPEPDAEDADLLVMEQKPDLCSSGSGSETFVLVPGRLSLLSATQKYKVSVDEVRRRLSHPECLNASVLGGILRRAKSKNGGHLLRQRLESIGLSLPPGRRKATELSLLTSLVEGEAEHLSRDFRRICDNYFPHQELAQIIGRQHVGTPQAQERVSMVKATQVVLSELQAMINAVGGPNNIRPTDPNNPYPGLTNFSLITHGFGNPAMDTMFSVVQTYLHELLAIYEGRVPIQANPQAGSSHGGSGSRAGSSRGHTATSFQTGLSLKQEPVDLH